MKYTRQIIELQRLAGRLPLMEQALQAVGLAVLLLV